MGGVCQSMGMDGKNLVYSSLVPEGITTEKHNFIHVALLTIYGGILGHMPAVLAIFSHLGLQRMSCVTNRMICAVRTLTHCVTQILDVFNNGCYSLGQQVKVINFSLWALVFFLRTHLYRL